MGRKGNRISSKNQKGVGESALLAKLDSGGVFVSENSQFYPRRRKGGDQLLLGEFKIQENVKIFGQLRDFDYFRRFDLEEEGYLSTVSKRIYGGFRKPFRQTTKHRLFNMHISNYPNR